MNISSGDEIAGFPAVKLRELFRYFSSRISVDDTAYFLGVGFQKAKALLLQLESEGYLISEPAKNIKSKFWEQTLKGSGLRRASAARPIKRATADQLLTGFIERIDEVNNSPDYLYKVTKVILFGSYLDETRTAFGDIDLAVELESKELDAEKAQKLGMEQAERETTDYKSYVSYMDMLYYSYNKVLRRLKNRSRAISLNGIHDAVLTSGIPTKVIFQLEDEGKTEDK